MPHSHIPIMLNFTLRVDAEKFPHNEHWCAHWCWCPPPPPLNAHAVTVITHKMHSRCKLFLTTKERPLFALKVVIPLKLRGNIAALTAPPLPPLLLKVLQCKMLCHYNVVLCIWGSIFIPRLLPYLLTLYGSFIQPIKSLFFVCWLDPKIRINGFQYIPSY